MKRKFGSVIIILILICFFALLYNSYNLSFSRNVAVVTFKEINKNKGIVKFADGSEKEIRIPDIVVPLLEKNEEYLVTIYQNKFKKPFLKKIEKNPGA